MITRIWEGKKEYSDKHYYQGQVWDPLLQIWVNVTQECENEDDVWKFIDREDRLGENNTGNGLKCGE